jgi:hypothetical protein
MANTIVISKIGPDADPILDEFAQQTGLRGEDETDRRVFAVQSAEEHGINVVETLDEIREDWGDHVRFEPPIEAE